jgi:hypothetical protein
MSTDDRMTFPLGIFFDFLQGFFYAIWSAKEGLRHSPHYHSASTSMLLKTIIICSSFRIRIQSGLDRCVIFLDFMLFSKFSA